MYYIGNSIIKNGAVESLSEQEPIGIDNEIYELIRVENGKALFIADHLKRLQNTMSAAKLNTDIISKLPQLIDWLIICNQQNNCNIRITITPKGIMQAGFVPSQYPTKQMYEDGVKTSILDATRNTPKLKIYHAQMRNNAQEQQKREKTYESLLVDQDGNITEGSRSNVFFIKDDKVFTAPDRMVLGGIVRKIVIEICKTHNIPLIEIPVNVDDIENYDKAFLTSTPARILPINSIADTKYNKDNELLKRIMTEMEKLVNKNIE